MLVSEKLGALPWLSFMWDHGPVSAALIMLAIDYGMICVLMMYVEGVPPWSPERTLYMSFKWGDTAFFPLYMAMAVVVLRSAPTLPEFCTSAWWHWSWLIGGVLASVLMEVRGVTGGQYTIGQEFSPSKLWHTCIFAVVAYWTATSIIPIFLFVHRPWWAMVLVVVAISGFIAVNRADWKRGLKYDRMHLTGTWVPWEWHSLK